MYNIGFLQNFNRGRGIIFDDQAGGFKFIIVYKFYLFIYICMWTCVYTCIHIYMGVYWYVYIYVRTYIYTTPLHK